MTKKAAREEKISLPLANIYVAPLPTFRDSFGADFKSLYKYNFELTPEDIKFIFKNLDSMIDNAREKYKIKNAPKPKPFVEPV